jgi:transcriptional regulator with XRE-family HTH domain
VLLYGCHRLTLNHLSVNIKAITVNRWTKAACAVLHAAGVSQAYVAEVELGISRAAVSPYLNGARKPSPEKVLDINDAIANATKDPGAAAYLDCEAVEADLLPISYLGSNDLVDGARLALEDLGVGLLVDDWPTRLASMLGKRNQEQIGKFLLAVNREHRRLLRNRTHVPWREAADAVVAVLKRFGLGDLITGKRAVRDRIDHFRAVVRQELDRVAGPSISARDRHAVENRIFAAALALLGRSEPSPSIAQLLGGEKS